MQITFLERKQKGGYWLNSSMDYPLTMLGRFLIDDSPCDFFRAIYLRYLKDPAQSDTEGNITFTEKNGANITIGNLYLEKPEDFSFTTSIQNLIEIIEQWGELNKKQPEYIVIKRKDATVFLEGCESLREQNYYKVTNPNKALFSRNENNSYFLQQSDVCPLTVFAFFLLDTGFDREKLMQFKQSLTSNDLMEKKGTTIWMKEPHEYIHIGLFFSPMKPNNSIKISSTNLAAIFDQWMSINQQKPLFVLVTRDGEKITLEGKEYITETDLL